jgi:hypothetical protein
MYCRRIKRPFGLFACAAILFLRLVARNATALFVLSQEVKDYSIGSMAELPVIAGGGGDSHSSWRRITVCFGGRLQFPGFSFFQPIGAVPIVMPKSLSRYRG